MPLSIQCTNSGCYNVQEPYLDPATDKVYCSSCDKELNVTFFIKSQMRANKQFKQKQKLSYSVTCSKCKNHDRPLVQNNDLICSSCKKPLDNLSQIYKNMLKEQLKSIDD